MRERGLLGTLYGLTRRVEHIQGLAMKGRSFILKHKSYGGVWGEIEERESSSSFHESYEEAFCETWMHKKKLIFTLEDLFLYKKGDSKLEPHSNLVLSPYSH